MRLIRWLSPHDRCVAERDRLREELWRQRVVLGEELRVLGLALRFERERFEWFGRHGADDESGIAGQ